MRSPNRNRAQRVRLGSKTSLLPAPPRPGARASPVVALSDENQRSPRCRRSGVDRTGLALATTSESDPLRKSPLRRASILSMTRVLRLGRSRRGRLHGGHGRQVRRRVSAPSARAPCRQSAKHHAATNRSPAYQTFRLGMRGAFPSPQHR